MRDERWHIIGLTHDGGQGVTVDGASVWDARWRSQRRTVPLTHPQYRSQVHQGSVYAWPDADPPLLLAVAEVSANVYVLAVSPPTAEVIRR